MDYDGCDFSYLNITCLEDTTFKEPIFGVILPVIFLITAITNAFIIAVMYKPRMRNFHNTMLAILSGAEILIIGIPLPWWLYLYTLGNHPKPLPSVAVCYTWRFMTYTLPEFVLLFSRIVYLIIIIERYLTICKPQHLQKLYSKSVITATVFLVLSVGITKAFFEYYFLKHKEYQLETWENYTNVTTCTFEITELSTEFMFPIMLAVFDHGFIKVFAYLAVIIMSVLICLEINHSHRQYENFLRENRIEALNNLIARNDVTILLIVLSIVTMFPEFFISIFVMLSYMHWNTTYLNVIMLLEVIIYAFFPLKFFFFCWKYSLFYITLLEILKSIKNMFVTVDKETYESVISDGAVEELDAESRF